MRWAFPLAALVASVSLFVGQSAAVSASNGRSGSTLAVGHSPRALFPGISEAPKLHRAMKWSREAFAPRLLSTAVARFAAGLAVVGLEGVSTRRLAGRGVDVVAADRALRVVEIKGDPSTLAKLSMDSLRAGNIRYVEPLQVATHEHQRNDPYTFQSDALTGQPYEWNFGAAGMDRALNVASGSPDILVGYVDSGYGDIPDLRGKVAESWWWTSEGTNALDTEGHGTFVGSLIAATNDDGLGMAGFCGACRIVPFRDVRGTSLSVALAIRKLTDEHIRVLNLSLGFAAPSFLVADALNYAIGAGVLPVISTGNDGASSVSFPASFVQPDNGALGYGLAVGASDVSGNPASFSNWGNRLSLLAPGTFNGSCSTGVFAALSIPASEFDSGGACGSGFQDSGGNHYAYWSGTSFAAPEVAGIAALVWSTNPALKNYQVVDILERTATRPDATWTPNRGWGVVNAAAAIELATGRSTADSLSIKNLVFAGSLTPGSSGTATASVAWADGASVAQATASCTTAIGGILSNAFAGSVSNGTGSCSFVLPVTAAGKVVTLSMVVTAGNVSSTSSVAGRASQVVQPVAKPKPKKHKR